MSLVIVVICCNGDDTLIKTNVDGSPRSLKTFGDCSDHDFSCFTRFIGQFGAINGNTAYIYTFDYICMWVYVCAVDIYNLYALILVGKLAKVRLRIVRLS